MFIEPLRKRTKTGMLYTRREAVVGVIQKSLEWGFEDLLERASIRSRGHADYIPSEVLLYHLRQTKSDNTDGRFQALYNVLIDRVEAACPRAVSRRGDQEYEDAHVAEIHDAITEKVIELILMDRQDYQEGLDAYEVFFDRAVRSVRITKFREVNSRENATESVVHQDGSDDVRQEVEEALERYKRSYLTPEEDFDYRLSLLQNSPRRWNFPPISTVLAW